MYDENSNEKLHLSFEEQRDVAQSGSATVWGTGGRKFESCHPDEESARALFLYRSKSNAKVLLFFEIRNSLDKNNHFVAERSVETVLPQGKTAEALRKKAA